MQKKIITIIFFLTNFSQVLLCVQSQSARALLFDCVQKNILHKNKTLEMRTRAPNPSTGQTGSTGATGSRGATGNTGATGAKGNTGATGTVGALGAKGNTGSTGAQGIAGNSGSQGNTGLTGQQGNTGTTGIQGNSGATGNPGEQGLPGQNGLQGATGSTGTQGDTGPQGSIGNTGSTGTNGAQGPIGPHGNTGSTGNSGTPGGIGPRGVPGPQGSAGPAGPRGSTGPTGPRGATGPARSINSMISAYDSSQQLLTSPLVFQKISFNNFLTLIGWTAINRQTIVCSIPGTYLITYSVQVQCDTTSNNMFFAYVAINNKPIPGSEIAIQLGNTISCATKTFTVACASCDSLTIEFSSNDASVRLAPIAFASLSSPSASLTIVAA